MQTTRLDVRKAFNSIGYTVTFKRNPFNSDLCNIGWKDSTMLKPEIMSSCNVYSADFVAKHKLAFDLANSYKQAFLTDTDQKIVS